jgi:hypothetical protein
LRVKLPCFKHQILLSFGCLNKISCQKV